MINVLVSGASGIVGYGILKSLRESREGIKLIATTIYQDSVAQGFSDIFELAPHTSSEKYISWLIGIVNKHNIKFLIPGIEDDLYKWVNFIEEIESTGAIILLNNLSLISLCKDKWAFFEYLKPFELPCLIESSISKDFGKLVSDFGLPFILKPRRGFGSKGIEIIEDENSFQKHKEKIGHDLLVQKIVGVIDEEYTTSAFCDGFGGFFCYMTLKRKLSKEGFTDRAEVVDVKEIYDVLASLCKIFKPKGPTNFQFRMDLGVLKLLEINPRISSSTSIRSAFGYNESLMAVDFYVNGLNPKQPIIRSGRAVRYMEDQITYL